INGALVSGLNFPTGIAVVPEPSAFLLAALGLFCSIAWRWRLATPLKQALLRGFAACIVAATASAAMADGYLLTNSRPLGGSWDGAGNWNFAGSPAGGDSATFNLASNYTVYFNSFPPVAPIQDLAVASGNVTFASAAAVGGSATLDVTSTTGGSQ